MLTKEEVKQIAVHSVMKKLEELHQSYKDANGNDLLIGGLDSYIYTEKLDALAQQKNFVNYKSFSLADEEMINEVRRHLERNRMIIVAAWGLEDRADLYVEPVHHHAGQFNVSPESESSVAIREVVGGPVLGHDGKKWSDFSQSLLKSDQLRGVFELVTSKGEGALGCVGCRAVTRLEQCSNCGGVDYSLSGSLEGTLRLYCVRCEQSLRSWECSRCDCKNPINAITLLSRVNAKSSMCFIATAACGDMNSPEVRYLSAFRDEFLNNRILGQQAIKIYSVASPPVAALISKSTLLQKAVRALMLKPLVQLLRRIPWRQRGLVPWKDINDRG